MTNNTNAADTMTHSQMMDARDGVAYLWIDPQHRFAKLVRDGKLIARIDRLADGSCRGTADFRTFPMFETWDAASAWIKAHTTSAVFESDLVILSV